MPNLKFQQPDPILRNLTSARFHGNALLRCRRVQPAGIDADRLRTQHLRNVEVGERALVVLLAYRRVGLPDVRAVHAQVDQCQPALVKGAAYLPQLVILRYPLRRAIRLPSTSGR